MRRVVPLLLASLLPIQAFAQSPSGADRDLENLVNRFNEASSCNAQPCPGPEVLAPQSRAVIRAFQRDVARLHDAVLRSLRGGADSSPALLELLVHANAIDDSILETVALRSKVALLAESQGLVEFLVSQLVSYAPSRNAWTRIVLADLPSRASDLRNQRRVIDQALRQGALPADLLELVLKRYPDLLARHAVSKHYPGFAPSVVQHIQASLGPRGDLLQVLATQLRSDLGVMSVLKGVPSIQTIRILAYASDGSAEHLELFLRELGKTDALAFRSAILTESPRKTYALDLSKIQPSPDTAAGMRVVLSSPLLFRIDVTGFTQFEKPEDGAAAKSAWIGWILDEWKANRIPRGRSSTPRWKPNTDAADRTDPFELLLALDVGLDANFHDLSVPAHDGQQARLIDEWCAKAGPASSVESILSELHSYGPEAFRAGIECAASHHGKIGWGRPIAQAIQKAPSDRVLDRDTQRSIGSGPWEASERLILERALEQRGAAGQVLASLFRFSGFANWAERESRVGALAGAFQQLTRVEPRLIEEGDITDAFVVAVEVLRAGLLSKGPLDRSSRGQIELINEEIDEAARRGATLSNTRALVNATRDKAKEGFRRWPFSI